MPRISPYDSNRLTVFNWNSQAVRLPKAVVLPRRDELPRSYTALVEFLRLLPEYCTELASVMLVATTQVKAHIQEATGGVQGLNRIRALYGEADEGDGGPVLLARLFNDLVFSGWWVAGNLYDGAIVTDLYHIDTAYTRFSIQDEVTNYGTFTRKESPLIYHRGGAMNSDRIPILRDVNGNFTEAWWDIAWPRTKEQIRDMGGWYPGAIPILGAYDLIRSLSLARALQHAEMSGEAVKKLAFVPMGLARQKDEAEDSAKANAETKDGNAIYDTLIIETLDKPEIAELVVREGMNATDMDITSKRTIILLSALIGVNPMDVDPSTSGAGGLNEGTKAKVADDLREGRLVSQFIKAFTAGFNKWTSPRSAEIAFTYNDPRDESRRIANATQIVGYVNAAKLGGLLTNSEQVARVLDYEEVFPPGVIVVPEESITTEDETENANLDTTLGLPASPALQPSQLPTTTDGQSQDVPADGAAPSTVGTEVQQLALNGAQVQSLVDTVTAVSSGELPAIAAIEIIRAAFPAIPAESVKRMVDAASKLDASLPSPANGQPPAAPPAPPGAQPDAPSVGKAKQIKKLSEDDLKRARKIFNAVKDLPIDEEE